MTSLSTPNPWAQNSCPRPTLAAPEAAVAISPLTGTADTVRRRVHELADAGMTEIAFQPVGDIRTELRTMAEALAHWI